MARTDTVLKVNNIDFSSNIIAGTYNIVDEMIYTEWQDANGRNHRDVYRTQLRGSFDMFFESVDDFEVFNHAYKAVRSLSGLTPVVIRNNSTNNLENKDVYLQFSPIRNRRDDWEDYYEQFTVEVLEW